MDLGCMKARIVQENPVSHREIFEPVEDPLKSKLRKTYAFSLSPACIYPNRKEA